VNQRSSKLIQFLQEELAIPATSIKLALRHHQQDVGQLPMVLWGYGLITLQQLDLVFDWLEYF
jgi:Protein of unknown function (DUF2949)